MVRYAIVLPALLALVPVAGCMGSKPLQVESLNQTLKDALPSSSATPPAVPPGSKDAAPVVAAKATSKHQVATQFVTAWRSQLGQLPDPTKNGAMKPGIVGQIFIMTDKYMPADVTGTLTIAASDATDRAPGQPAKQPNAWHFDVETLKRMAVVDDRFGKCIAVFLPWPEEWNDVSRLQIQARYDQAGPGTYTLYAPQSNVTLDFINNGAQVNTSQGRFTAHQMTVPDPKVMAQQAKATAARGVVGTPSVSVPPPSSPILQTGFQQAAWPNVNPGVSTNNVPLPQPTGNGPFPTAVIDNMTPQPVANGSVQKDPRFVVPRN